MIFWTAFELHIQLSSLNCELNSFIQLVRPVEDPVNEIEDGILATYLPNEAGESEADIPLAIPPPVTPHEALAHMEGLLLFSLQAELTANIDELQEVLKCEQQRIETLEIRRRRSLTFWCLSEPLPPPPPSLLEILVPPPTLICPFMFLLYLSTYPATCSTIGELDSIFPYFPCI